MSHVFEGLWVLHQWDYQKRRCGSNQLLIDEYQYLARFKYRIRVRNLVFRQNQISPTLYILLTDGIT